jgi:photosystem II stability/assembly factor-like uncharacterized protein
VLHPRVFLNLNMSSPIFRPLFTLVSLALAAALNAQQNAPAAKNLLIVAKNDSLASAQAAAKPFGVVSARDKRSGMFRVTLRPGVNVAQARRQIERAPGIEAVTNGTPAVVDRLSDLSVTDHVEYLRQLEEHAPKKQTARKGSEEKNPQLNWWEAYRYYIHDRVNRNGTLDAEPFRIAAAHRDQMPPAHLSRPGQYALSGTWGYVGPKNLEVPYRIYYGFKPLSGRINAIAVNPSNHSIIYIAGADGGVWKTTNGGTSWTPLSDKWTYLQVSSIAIDPAATNTIYVGTGDFQGGTAPYSMGIMKSTDGGVTWTNYGASTFQSLGISKIVIDPANSQTVLATAGRLGNVPGGIFRSTNGGQTWTRVDGAGDWYCDLDVSIPDAQGNRTWWAVGEANSGAPLKSSTDHGLTWTPVAGPFDGAVHYSTALACSKTAAGTVYLLDPDSASPSQGFPASNSHIWKTIDFGAHWTDISAGFPNSNDPGDYYNWSQDSYDWHIHTSTTTVNGVTKDAVYVGLITIAMSPDGGASWIDLGRTFLQDSSCLVHQDQHSFAVDPTNPNITFVGSDGGIFRTVYDPAAKTATFTGLNSALGISQFYKIAVHPTDPTRVMGGTQDNAGPASAGDLNNWINPGAGDGAFVAYDPFDPNIAYTGSQGLSINRTKDGWANNLGDITPQGMFGSEAVNFIPPFVLANKGAAASKLYAGTDHLWSWDETNGWIPDLGGQRLTFSRSGLRIVATCPNDNQRIYTGGDDGQMWMSGDLGAHWTEVDNNVFSAPVVAISPSTTNAKDVLVGLTQFSSGGNLFRCTDTSAAAPSWSNAVSGSGATGLPQIPINTIARDPYAPTTTWYVGNDVGVFMTTNSGSTWSNMTQPLGLPNVQVNDLKVNTATGYLYAGTFGRGMWRIKLVNPATLAVSSVSLSPTSVAGGATSTFTVNLNNTAPVGGTVVTLSSNTARATIQGNLTVPSGQTSAQATVHTTSGAAATATITATLGVAKSAALTITGSSSGPDISDLTAPSAVASGNPMSCTVTLSGAAPSGGTPVAITFDTGAFVLPSPVTVAAGQTSKTFTVNTNPIDLTSSVVRHIIAKHNTVTLTSAVTVFPASVSALTLTPSTLTGAGDVTVKITLNSPASPHYVLNVTTTDATHVPVPATVQVPYQAKTFSFVIHATDPPANENVTIKVSRTNTRSAVLTLNH